MKLSNKKYRELRDKERAEDAQLAQSGMVAYRSYGKDHWSHLFLEKRAQWRKWGIEMKMLKLIASFDEAMG